MTGEKTKCKECRQLVEKRQRAQECRDYSAATDAKVLLARHRAMAHPAEVKSP